MDISSELAQQLPLVLSSNWCNGSYKQQNYCLVLVLLAEICLGDGSNLDVVNFFNEDNCLLNVSLLEQCLHNMQDRVASGLKYCISTPWQQEMVIHLLSHVAVQNPWISDSFTPIVDAASLAKVQLVISAGTSREAEVCINMPNGIDLIRVYPAPSVKSFFMFLLENLQKMLPSFKAPSDQSNQTMLPNPYQKLQGMVRDVAKGPLCFEPPVRPQDRLQALGLSVPESSLFQCLQQVFLASQGASGIPFDPNFPSIFQTSLDRYFGTNLGDTQLNRTQATPLDSSDHAGSVTVSQPGDSEGLSTIFDSFSRQRLKTERASKEEAEDLREGGERRRKDSLTWQTWLNRALDFFRPLRDEGLTLYEAVRQINRSVIELRQRPDIDVDPEKSFAPFSHIKDEERQKLQDSRDQIAPLANSALLTPEGKKEAYRQFLNNPSAELIDAELECMALKLNGYLVILSADSPPKIYGNKADIPMFIYCEQGRYYPFEYAQYSFQKKLEGQSIDQKTVFYVSTDSIRPYTVSICENLDEVSLLPGVMYIAQGGYHQCVLLKNKDFDAAAPKPGTIYITLHDNQEMSFLVLAEDNHDKHVPRRGRVGVGELFFLHKLSLPICFYDDQYKILFSMFRDYTDVSDLISDRSRELILQALLHLFSVQNIANDNIFYKLTTLEGGIRSGTIKREYLGLSVSGPIDLQKVVESPGMTRALVFKALGGPITLEYIGPDGAVHQSKFFDTDNVTSSVGQLVAQDALNRDYFETIPHKVHLIFELHTPIFHTLFYYVSKMLDLGFSLTYQRAADRSTTGQFHVSAVSPSWHPHSAKNFLRSIVDRCCKQLTDSSEGQYASDIVHARAKNLLVHLLCIGCTEIFEKVLKNLCQEGKGCLAIEGVRYAFVAGLVHDGSSVENPVSIMRAVDAVLGLIARDSTRALAVVRKAISSIVDTQEHSSPAVAHDESHCIVFMMSHVLRRLFALSSGSSFFQHDQFSEVTKLRHTALRRVLTLLLDLVVLEQDPGYRESLLDMTQCYQALLCVSEMKDGDKDVYENMLRDSSIRNRVGHHVVQKLCVQMPVGLASDFSFSNEDLRILFILRSLQFLVLDLYNNSGKNFVLLCHADSNTSDLVIGFLRYVNEVHFSILPPSAPLLTARLGLFQSSSSVSPGSRDLPPTIKDIAERVMQQILHLASRNSVSQEHPQTETGYGLRP